MDTTDVLAAVQPLVDAGKTLGSIASRNRDLLHFAGDLNEIAADLGRHAKIASATWEHASDLELRSAEHAAAAEAAGYRTAIRAAKRAIVELARVIWEMEAQAGQEGR